MLKEPSDIRPGDLVVYLDPNLKGRRRGTLVKFLGGGKAEVSVFLESGGAESVEADVMRLERWRPELTFLGKVLWTLFRFAAWVAVFVAVYFVGLLTLSCVTWSELNPTDVVIRCAAFLYATVLLRDCWVSKR